LHSGSLEE